MILHFKPFSVQAVTKKGALGMEKILFIIRALLTAACFNFQCEGVQFLLSHKNGKIFFLYQNF